MYYFYPLALGSSKKNSRRNFLIMQRKKHASVSTTTRATEQAYLEGQRSLSAQSSLPFQAQSSSPILSPLSPILLHARSPRPAAAAVSGSKGRAMGWAARFLTAAAFLAAGLLFAPDALRLGGGGGEVGPPPRVRHGMGRRALGHLRRRHRHVQVSRRLHPSRW